MAEEDYVLCCRVQKKNVRKEKDVVAIILLKKKLFNRRQTSKSGAL
jgi:hypothetical protein